MQHAFEAIGSKFAKLEATQLHTPNVSYRIATYMSSFLIYLLQQPEGNSRELLAPHYFSSELSCC